MIVFNFSDIISNNKEKLYYMSESNPIVERFYGISEKSGEIWGKVVAGILNTTTSVTSVSIEAFKKGNNKFIENVKPAYYNTKNTFNDNMVNLVPEKYKNYFTKKELDSNIASNN